MLEKTKKKTLILAHRSELVHQISKSLPVKHALIMPGYPEADCQVSVGMMQTVSRRLDRLPQFDWVISDEAHLAMCPTWIKILHHYSSAWHLGMSASPCRLDGKGLGDFYDSIVYGPTIPFLIENEFLVPVRVFAPNVNVGPIKMSGSDYSMGAAADAFGKPRIVGDAIKHVLKHAPDRLTIVFCCSRKRAEETAEAFTAAGLPAVNVDGALPHGERQKRIDAFRSGAIRVLTNVDLLTTGFDMPEIGACVFLRPTCSLALYLQMIGRIMRRFPGKKDAILFDHANNVAKHGLPDAVREWTLDGAAPKKKKNKDEPDAAPVRQCSECYCMHAPAPVCPECGHVYPVKSREVEQVDGELMELDAATLERMRTAPLRQLLSGAQSREDLQRIAKVRGYKRGWVQHVQRERDARRFSQ
jgi:superfamily II DNA or RNA helicase